MDTALEISTETDEQGQPDEQTSVIGPARSGRATLPTPTDGYRRTGRESGAFLPSPSGDQEQHLEQALCISTGICFERKKAQKHAGEPSTPWRLVVAPEPPGKDVGLPECGPGVGSARAAAGEDSGKGRRASKSSLSTMESPTSCTRLKARLVFPPRERKSLDKQDSLRSSRTPHPPRDYYYFPNWGALQSSSSSHCFCHCHCRIYLHGRVFVRWDFPWCSMPVATSPVYPLPSPPSSLLESLSHGAGGGDAARVRVSGLSVRKTSQPPLPLRPLQDGAVARHAKKSSKMKQNSGNRKRHLVRRPQKKTPGETRQCRTWNRKRGTDTCGGASTQLREWSSSSKRTNTSHRTFPWLVWLPVVSSPSSIILLPTSNSHRQGACTATSSQKATTNTREQHRDAEKQLPATLYSFS